MGQDTPIRKTLRHDANHRPGEICMVIRITVALDVVAYRSAHPTTVWRWSTMQRPTTWQDHLGYAGRHLEYYFNTKMRCCSRDYSQRIAQTIYPDVWHIPCTQKYSRVSLYMALVWHCRYNISNSTLYIYIYSESSKNRLIMVIWVATDLVVWWSVNTRLIIRST